jgi:DNA-directed RNA polymerase specialized sigma24 family protein
LSARDATEFESFVRDARPRLLRALAGVRGREADDATAEALAYAWEHWIEVRRMSNPIGYLYRVGQGRTRARRVLQLPAPESIGLPEVELALIPALLRLPESQRTAVWLVHGCGWSYSDVAQAMETSTSMVGNHVRRARARLRRAMEVEPCA